MHADTSQCLLKLFQIDTGCSASRYPFHTDPVTFALTDVLWKRSSENLHLTVLFILLHDDILIALYGVCNLVQQVAPRLTGQALQSPGCIPCLDGQLPTAVGSLRGSFRVCVKGKTAVITVKAAMQADW